jgi:hypothetical protein
MRRTVHGAKVVKTPGGICWQIGEEGGGQLRQDLVVSIREPGGAPRPRISLHAHEYPLGTELVVSGEGLVRKT